MPQDRDRPVRLIAANVHDPPRYHCTGTDRILPARRDSVSLRISGRRISPRINSESGQSARGSVAGYREGARDFVGVDAITRDPRLCEPGSSFTSDRIASSPPSSPPFPFLLFLYLPRGGFGLSCASSLCNAYFSRACTV